MDLDLAVFRLNALATLTATDVGGRRAGAANNDFFNTLLNAQLALHPGAGGAAAGLGGGLASARLDAVLGQLEASNATFMRRYNARVGEIGDEARVLEQLRARVAELGKASRALGQIDGGADDAAVTAAVQGFIARYNAWDAEFDPYFEAGGLLADNQAGEVARFSLRREVGSIFHGAGNGGHALGFTDMGLSFTADGQAVLDEAAFAAALGANRSGALQTLANVAQAFGDAAELLAADGHLLDRRIDNAARAVAWAADNQRAVEAEFGPGALTARVRS